MSIIVGERPNPTPICLGTMSHEHKEEESKVFLRQSFSEAVRTKLFERYHSQTAGSKWPRVKQSGNKPRKGNSEH